MELLEWDLSWYGREFSAAMKTFEDDEPAAPQLLKRLHAVTASVEVYRG